MTRPLMWLGFARGARDAETTRQTGRQRCGAIDARVTRQSPCDLRNPQHGTRRAEMTECRKRRHRLRKSLHRGSHLEQHGSVVAGLRHVPAASISARTSGTPEANPLLCRHEIPGNGQQPLQIVHPHPSIAGRSMSACVAQQIVEPILGWHKFFRSGVAVSHRALSASDRGRPSPAAP